ncbi:malonate decarboxylase holo-ACP synthase [Streptosporangium sp. NBC_01495]|uniref:malonate decarboxylase holo-ACP synthase n=1 Tax=Streptosporangium sp. NBC_01495 TaxID=2903899 RepID=UPI002E3253FF|nr:malonate decarboxylase holo-ACP synthase [Streptosporangium sp. NBC_01495]
MAVTARPHDLLRLSGAAALQDTSPAWVPASITACPWGVVRRAPHPPGLVPIGIRGTERWQRHAALVPTGAVIRSVPPEELRGRRPWLPLLAVTLSAVALLLAGELDAGAAWGPIGGVGFELATGQPVTHPGSDLDLLIRAPHRLDRTLARRLTAVFAALPGPVDCQLETPGGGVGLTEWARTGGPVMARTDHGPHLVDDPWAPA